LTTNFYLHVLSEFFHTLQATILHPKPFILY